MKNLEINQEVRELLESELPVSLEEVLGLLPFEEKVLKFQNVSFPTRPLHRVVYKNAGEKLCVFKGIQPSRLMEIAIERVNNSLSSSCHSLSNSCISPSSSYLGDIYIELDEWGKLVLAGGHGIDTMDRLKDWIKRTKADAGWSLPAAKKANKKRRGIRA